MNFPIDQNLRAARQLERITRRTDNSIMMERSMELALAALFFEEKEAYHIFQCDYLTNDETSQLNMKLFIEIYGKNYIPEPLINYAGHLRNWISPHIIPKELSSAADWILTRGLCPYLFDHGSEEFWRFQGMMLAIFEHIYYAECLDEGCDTPLPRLDAYPELSEEKLVLESDM